MKLALILTFVTAATLLAACSHQNTPNSSTPRASEFETIKDPPINARTRFAAGQLAEAQGRMEQAVDQYRQALALEPKYADAMFHLGVAYAQVKDYPHAIETWNKYVTLTGGSGTAYGNLGFCQELAGNPAAAEVAYKKGVSQDPHSESCRVNYGLMLARHNRPNEALLQLQVVLTPAQAHYDLASVYELQNRKSEARSEYGKAIELDPQLDEARAKLAAMP